MDLYNLNQGQREIHKVRTVGLFFLSAYVAKFHLQDMFMAAGEDGTEGVPGGRRW